MPAAAASPPTHDLSALAKHLVSPKTGILKRILLVPRSPGEIGILYPAADLPDYVRIPFMGAIDGIGGTGFTASESLARVLFETVERYCGAFADYDRMYFGKAPGPEFLTGERFPLFSSEQYQQPRWPFMPLTSDSEIWWTEMRSLLTGRPVYIPSVSVYVPYRVCGPAECLGPSVSTGMAAGWSIEEACLSGLLEICERDAFAIMWMHSLSMPRIVIDPESRFGRELDSVLGPSGGRVWFVNLTNDLGVPVVACVLRQQFEGKPLLTVGAAAKLDYEAACRKAFAEAANGYSRVAGELASHAGWPRPISRTSRTGAGTASPTPTPNFSRRSPS
jgi:ribosomal protein S12 methylthiotransferase accessory factor